MKKKQKKEELSKESRKAAFECVANDLPDGAYFAIMEEFDLEPEDFFDDDLNQD